MAYIILPSRWNRQPTQPVGIDWSHPLSRGLIGYWNFGVSLQNIVSNAFDSVNGTTRFSAGPGGRGFDNDANSFVSAANLGNWNSLDELTVVIFARLNASSDSYASLWAKQTTAGSNSIQLQREGTADRVYVDTNGGINFTTAGGFAPTKFTGKDSVIGLTWLDYEIIGGEGKYYGYVDGRLGEEISSAYKLPVSGTGDLKIGAARDASTLAWGGIYYGAGVWKRGLSSGEHKALGESFWQVLRPIQLRIYVPSAGGAGAVNVNLSGLAATGAVGSLARAHARALSGLAATGAQGTLGRAHARALAGLATVGAVGTFGRLHARALAGLAASGALGSITPVKGAGVALSGLAATGAVGAFAVKHARALAGLAVTGAVGALAPSTGKFVSLSGLAGTGAVGSLRLEIRVALGGLGATAAVGALGLSTPVAVTLAGLAATGAVGSVSPGYYNIITHRPDEDLAAGAWLPSTGADLYATIDEAVTDDADYDYTESASTMRLGLPAMTDPGVNYAHRFTYRIQGDGSTTIVARVGAGPTAVVEYTHAPAPSVLTTYTQTLSSGEVIAFRSGGGYANGWIEFEAA